MGVLKRRKRKFEYGCAVCGHKPKRRPYGSKRTKFWCSKCDRDLVGSVNKKRERQKGKRKLKKMFNYILKKYTELILNTKPSRTWKAIRFVLHWVTLPLKLILIGGLGTYQIIKHSFTKHRPYAVISPDVRKARFKTVFERLPIFHTTEIKLHVNRVPYYSVPNGSNHNSDHQCSRHSTFAFLLSKMGIHDELVDKATWMHMQGKWLCRGYEWGPEGLHFNAKTTSGDMLCGLNLAVMTTENEATKERFDQLIHHIIENDYSVLEGQSPDSDSMAYDMYQRKLKEANYAIEKIEMKSERGMWQPGLETVGAQALTILASLKLAEKKLGSRDAKKAYNKLLWKYGYGLLSLFPTAYIDSKRGYFNDHNCLISLYVLSNLSSSRLGKLFWKIPMVYVWALSKHWYNGYFTGLLNSAHPGTVSEEYIEDCKGYLYENAPRTWGYMETTTSVSKEVPVTFNNLPEDEFSPDIPHNLEVITGNEDTKIKTGLGFIASAIMLEKDPRGLLE